VTKSSIEEGHAAIGTGDSVTARRGTWVDGLTFVIMLLELGVDAADEVEELRTKRYAMG